MMLVSLGGWGCTPSIGDKCVLSTDCSIRGERLCDTSQPGGYCTIFNCRANLCPDEATCVMFHAAVPGCSYNDRAGGVGSRVARTFCVAHCEADGDCRAGYVCADPRKDPWRATILDDDQGKRVCIPPDLAKSSTSSQVDDVPVCKPGGPDVEPIEAGTNFDGAVRDAGAPDAPADAPDAD
jgi:hypothetical protein